MNPALRPGAHCPNIPSANPYPTVTAAPTLLPSTEVPHPVAPAALSVQRLPGHWNSLGLAAHFVARFEPFARFGAADLVRTLDAQIERGHALFALEGTRLVGYLGWAFYDAAVAEPFARGGPPPPNALAHGHDVLWILTMVATHPRALRALVRTVWAQHPGMRVMGVRHKADGQRVVFNRAGSSM